MGSSRHFDLPVSGRPALASLICCDGSHEGNESYEKHDGNEKSNENRISTVQRWCRRCARDGYGNEKVCMFKDHRCTSRDWHGTGQERWKIRHSRPCYDQDEEEASHKSMQKDYVWERNEDCSKASQDSREGFLRISSQKVNLKMRQLSDHFIHCPLIRGNPVLGLSCVGM